MLNMCFRTTLTLAFDLTLLYLESVQFSKSDSHEVVLHVLYVVGKKF